MKHQMSCVHEENVRVRAYRQVSSLLSFRTLCEGRKHVPHVQYTITFGQYVLQLAHCMLGVISRISKYSMFPMLEIIFLDCSLNGLSARFCFRSACNASLCGSVSN